MRNASLLQGCRIRFRVPTRLRKAGPDLDAGFRFDFASISLRFDKAILCGHPAAEGSYAFEPGPPAESLQGFCCAEVATEVKTEAFDELARGVKRPR